MEPKEPNKSKKTSLELKLLEFPGVGPKMKDRLIEYFGDEDSALNAISKGDIAGLMNVLSERQAITLTQWARGLKFGVDPENFIATDEAKEIYLKLMDKIANFVHTDFARLKLSTLFPSSSQEMIEENSKLAKYSIDIAKKLSKRGLEELLGKVKPLRDKTPPKIKDRCIAVDSPDRLDYMRERGIDKLIDIHIIDSPIELKDISNGYSHVYYTGDFEVDSINVEMTRNFETWNLVPESVIFPFNDNLDILIPAIKVAEILDEVNYPLPDGWTSLRALSDLSSEEMDEESQRITRLLNSIEKVVLETTEWANLELKKRIEASSVTLAGMDLLQALDKGDGVRELFEIKVRSVFLEVIREAYQKLVSQLEVSGREAIALEEMFAPDISYPLQIDRQALHRLVHELRQKIAERKLLNLRTIAKELTGKGDIAHRLVSSILEFDFIYSVGIFALKEDLVMPDLVKKPCMGFVLARNLFLITPEPVSYSLGKSGFIDHEQRVAILSGVNSGGKTSLLNLIAEIVILAQMGMPVPAKAAKLCIFKELYYFGKNRGTLSAGAFETAMRKFSVVENDMQKLVLADELEAITEPGASARIIAAMLDELNQHDSLAVFVSHLAEDIQRYAITPIRIDGIEAEGLDLENNLVVDRSPRYNYLAKSTPELILDRLVRTTKGREHAFYKRLLDKFRD